MCSDTLIIHIARHNFGCALNFVIRPATKSVWMIAPFPTVKVKYDQFITRIIRDVNINRLYVTCGLNICQSLRKLPFSRITNLLPDNLQRLRRYPENQPSTICIEKCTRRMHTVFKFSGSFLKLQSTRLIVCNQCFYIVYCHLRSYYTYNH